MARMADGKLARWGEAARLLNATLWGIMPMIAGALILDSQFWLGSLLILVGDIWIVLLLLAVSPTGCMVGVVPGNKRSEREETLIQSVVDLARITQEYMEIVENDRNQIWDYILTKRRGD